MDQNRHDLPAICKTATDFLSHDYDFIIVGGGTAGLTIAARLTEDSKIKVGVLEAGPVRLDNILVETSALFGQMLGDPEYDWCLKTKPQEANNGIVHHLTRGKMLGGSSGINYMMYVRGSDADYDDWATLLGDDSWSSQAMKEYQRKHQTLEAIDPSIIDRTHHPLVGEIHGTSGPLRTSFNDTAMPIERLAIEAMEEASGIMGKPLDPWSGDHIGVFNTLGFIARSGPNKGKRSCAANEYFERNAGRPNLKLLCDALVSEIVLEGGSATGIEFAHAGKKHYVGAGSEVILCGGTFHSPQLLELSRIGDPNILDAVGVECKVAQPGVGTNYQDHLLSITGFELKAGLHSADMLHHPEVMASVQAQHAVKGWPTHFLLGRTRIFPL